MKIVRMNQVSKQPATSPLFTGKEVTRQILFPESEQFNVNIVNFGQGVRNKFHSHDSDQVLIVVSGKGVVATEDGERVVIEGDVILIPAGEKHWHGATGDSAFSHIYVTRVGSVMTQLEE